MAKRYRALVDMGLRQSPDPSSPKYNEWHEWPAGTVFTPPKHMNVKKALERGIMEEVAEGQGPAPIIKGGGSA